ncbi:HPr family phosphocarrier protein [Iocasia frigidifontis]|uniref:Phosphocarrier protein HPr n=1 Tax=Iocasia fonsfrigidae TaxID=2682810 RepID=A0A8A7KP64_9FIRM|nr:HPr family phosphocarrier protein [Iocasia fonsfrigidae]AZO93572.1 HPr family phosphocarrier protein [Halocella sp. SP3-1]MTI61970.1 HPr family phosphocarrier protein [Bacillota bacterium]QTL99844.1 HPr family phosphocarrier protein [Iocasia fonsfrigidae]
MLQDKIRIVNESGLHARPATLLTQKAANYKSEILIIYNDKEANAKSILSVMSLGVSCGKEITLKVEGEDEERALKELKEFFASGMGEEE